MKSMIRFCLVLSLLAAMTSSLGLAQNTAISWFSLNGGFAVLSEPNTTITSAAGVLVGSGHEPTNFVASGFLANPQLLGILVNVGENKELPLVYSLSQNYPNPFNPSTTITYELPKTSHVSLSVFDILGREVSVLVNERKETGVHEVKFDGSSLASGAYLCRLQAGTFVQSRKLLLIR